MFLFLDFFFVAKVRPHSDCWNSYYCLYGSSESNFLCSVKKSDKGKTLL
jgi:hypothetical protein